MFTDESATDYNPYFLLADNLGGCMKHDSFEIDRHLYVLLCQETYRQFTTRQLRDAYAASLEPANFELGGLRIYVYEQIRRLIRSGWVTKAPQLQKRGQVFQVLGIPQRLNLVLVDGHFPAATSSNQEKCEDVEPHAITPPPAAKSTPDDNSRLEVILNETRLDLLSSMGETERYKQLFQ